MASSSLRFADYFRHEKLLDSLAQPAALIRGDHRILRANRPYRERFAEGEDVRGRLCYRVTHAFSQPCSNAGIKCPLDRVVTTGKCCRSLHTHRSDDGSRPEEVCFFPVFDGRGSVHAALEVICQHPGDEADNGSETEMVGNSMSFNRMMSLIAQVARTDTTVLLLGESGTGKEVAARAIHKLSRRAGGNFVSVACTEIAESLLESELFGHEKGSFTGASGRREGLIEASHGGTLFLDEVGDMSLPLQIKLLRVLDRGVYRRVGSTKERASDFRLICATHRDLGGMVSEGQFRHDLYYRISAFPITVPPMRDRMEDLPLLIDTLRRRLGCGAGCRPDRRALKTLSSYSFPGNVRELLNILQRACLLAEGNSISPRHLPVECNSASSEVPGPGATGILPIEEVELRYLQWAASTFEGTRQELARQLGMSERSLYRKLRRALRRRP